MLFTLYDMIFVFFKSLPIPQSINDITEIKFIFEDTNSIYTYILLYYIVLFFSIKGF